MRFRQKLIIMLALSLASTGALAANGGYKGLPGVKSPQQQAAERSTPECGSSIQLRYYFSRQYKTPVRVYDCTDGNVSYQSTMPPLYESRPADPYTHGQNYGDSIGGIK